MVYDLRTPSDTTVSSKEDFPTFISIQVGVVVFIYSEDLEKRIVPGRFPALAERVFLLSSRNSRFLFAHGRYLPLDYPCVVADSADSSFKNEL